jgi:hypothetical protein
MKNVQKIIDLAGGLESGKGLYIENGAYQPLHIERMPSAGPHGHPAFSVGHYYEANGDLVPDLEIRFEVVERPDADKKIVKYWYPYQITQGPMGVHREVYTYDADRKPVGIRLLARREIESLARLWDRNIKDQGFVKAASEKFAAKK